MIICSMPGCQTTAGCICDRAYPRITTGVDATVSAKDAEILRLRAEVERLTDDIQRANQLVNAALDDYREARAEERERAAQIAEKHNILAAALIRASKDAGGGE